MTGFTNFFIGQTHRVGRRAPTKQPIELRETEIEGIALVNQRPFDAVAKGLRKHGAEFESAEAHSKNEIPLFHRVAFDSY